VAAVEVAPDFSGSAAEIKEYCRVYLARYKVPEQIVVVDELPRNAMGKVQRAQLVDLFMGTSNDG
jgi:long-chain acyl-CoA synthetase